MRIETRPFDLRDYMRPGMMVVTIPRRGKWKVFPLDVVAHRRSVLRGRMRGLLRALALIHRTYLEFLERHYAPGGMGFKAARRNFSALSEMAARKKTVVPESESVPENLAE